ncbi:glutamine synthetase family protein [Streptomyces sp. SID3343]|uniref:glutamine synthetase family protein n=1 Tax=Streptomyces sp. SID3343 TaxID=2690260 RepID=UPI00136F4DC7|nr:glutamine synthetase family protein [Streptomyces sp. SID3343]MYV98084.1 glutamine synthetase [Streptomyces sp. SID3343]
MPLPSDLATPVAPDAASAERPTGAAIGTESTRIDAVVIGWVDNAGVTRVKAVPRDRLDAVATHGVGFSPVFDVFLADDSITAGRLVGGPAGDLRLIPDLTALRPLAAQPGWAWAPGDRYTQDGVPYDGCQRTFARRMTARAGQRGLTLRMGFEVEWTTGVEDPAGRFVPAFDKAAYGMTRLIRVSDQLRELVLALAAQGVSVQQVHPEYAAGQLEVSVACEDPVGAADTTVLVRETIRAVAARHGHSVTFAPCVVPGEVGNGAHLHFSPWRDGINLCHGGEGPHGLTREGEAFLAGVLRELPALLAIGAPGAASHLRLVPSQWAGVHQCWGLENREAALRLVTGMAGERQHTANAEVKCFDATANPYLVTGSVIAAGLAGTEEGLRLPPEVPGDPAASVEAVRRLPDSPAAALEALEASAVLREALGEVLFDAVTAVRRAEIELAKGLTPGEIAARARRLY